MTAVETKQRHQPCEIRHRDDIDWETIRWPAETGKMLFHPRPERPTEPNAGILRLEPGAHHPDPQSRLRAGLVRALRHLRRSAARP